MQEVQLNGLCKLAVLLIHDPSHVGIRIFRNDLLKYNGVFLLLV